jgi:iron complex outermembrane receptor protein
MNMNTTLLPRRTFPLSLLALAMLSTLSPKTYAATDSDPTKTTQLDATQTLPTIQVKAQPMSREDLPSDMARQFPASTASITAEQAAKTINVVNTEDALKYLPNVLVRKRYIGDTQAPLATRTTGINGSARSLIFADGVLLSTLINNNNGNGSPQWFMVAPEEIARIDMMYGPYSAAYAGNSYGAVAEITTKMPEHFEASASIRGATQDSSVYESKDRDNAGQFNLFLGNKAGDFSWLLTAEHLDSISQPITFGTIAQSTKVAAANLPVVNGAIADQNRTGGGIQVLGAGNFVHTIQDNVKLKMAYDFTPTLSAAYMIGFWQNQADAKAKTYLNVAGSPYYGASTGNVNIGGYAYSASSIAGQFSSNDVEQQHLLQSLTIKTHDQDGFNWSMIASNMNYLQDQTRTSTGLYPTAQYGGTGRITDASGTGWTTLDLKGSWSSPEGILAAHNMSFGAHEDWFKLESPTYNTTNWINGENGSLYSNSVGQTQTQALWLQDVWQLTPVLKATVGGRYEKWQATDGYNFSTASNGKGYAVNQPNVDKSGFSPKASLAWTINDLWTMTGSMGKA